MIQIYTDGACQQIGHTGRGPGGWAVIVLKDGNPHVEFGGGEPDTTNNRMELQAVVEGLRSLGGNKQEVTVYSDSAYLVNCIENRWYAKWQRNGWQTSAKQPVLNRDLWEAILDLMSRHKVWFTKVKGHANDELNNRCDRLAVAEARKYR